MGPGLGIPEYEAKRYEGKVKEGGILISVHAEDGDAIDRAKRVFEQHNAQDIAAASEAKPGGAKNRDRNRTKEADTTTYTTPTTPPVR